MEELITFEDLGLDEQSLSAVEAKGFESPTPIQVLAIPRLLNGDANVIARARTGTGKTAAFGIPLTQTIRNDSGYVRALVLTPTRELALQVGKEIESLRIRVSGYGNQSIACSPDNRYLVSSSDDMLYVWEIQTGNTVFSMPYEDIYYSCFSKEGDKILFTSGFANKEKDIKVVDFLSDDELIDWFKNKMPKRKKSER